MSSPITIQVQLEAQARQVARLRDRRSMQRPGAAFYAGRRRDSGFLQYQGADGSLSLARSLANSRPEAMPPIVLPGGIDGPGLVIQRNA